MIDRLAELEARYEEISRQLSTPEAADDLSHMAELGRELSRLDPCQVQHVLDQISEPRGIALDDAEEHVEHGRIFGAPGLQRLGQRSELVGIRGLIAQDLFLSTVAVADS